MMKTQNFSLYHKIKYLTYIYALVIYLLDLCSHCCLMSTYLNKYKNLWTLKWSLLYYSDLLKNNNITDSSGHNFFSCFCLKNKNKNLALDYEYGIILQSRIMRLLIWLVLLLWCHFACKLNKVSKDFIPACRMQSQCMWLHPTITMHVIALTQHF